MKIDKNTRILCVCTNNYFRSIITEQLLRARGYLNVRSAGTHSGYIGIPPSGNVLRALRRRGVDCQNYSAQQLRGSDVLWAEVVLCAENEHAEDIANTYNYFGELMVMGIIDGGVSNEDAVERAATEIVAVLDRWSL